MSPVSAASSPSVDGAPRALAPLVPFCANGSSSLQTNAPYTPSLLTHKEWVIPPRPKPGRKPATDTPPTKRKAQNRAAQRAFRERRAAKVGELEEQMKEMEDEDEREQNELRSQIYRLESDVGEYERVVTQYSERMKALEIDLARERELRVEVQRELAAIQGNQLPIDVVPLALRKKARDAPKLTANAIPETSSFAEAAVGCGNCDTYTRCKCIEEAVDMASLVDDDFHPSPKRHGSPSQPEHSKRLRYSSFAAAMKPEEPVETDFTNHPFSHFSGSSSQQKPGPTDRGLEGCGLCKDSTACLCAELAEDERNSSVNGSSLSRLLVEPSESNQFGTPINYLHVANPDPLLTILKAASCSNNPGSCTQCQNSPTSTLFCKSLAATRRGENNATSPPPSILSQSSSQACCGKSSNCCGAVQTPLPDPTPSSSRLLVENHHHPSTQLSPPSSASPISGPTLSCADTFTTLSRHPGFDRASDELGVWLPKLATVHKGVEGRTAFEIEAASVMGVLKLFDRRFGRGE
ncbi:hypothetical protein MMC13_004464 [Lambiella insularis]|nr:hypothetical protein [Lambiella insularis]